MYVVYTTAAGEGDIHIRFSDIGSGFFYYPSESIWMIPGTVDPRDD